MQTHTQDPPLLLICGAFCTSHHFNHFGASAACHHLCLASTGLSLMLQVDMWARKNASFALLGDGRE